MNPAAPSSKGQVHPPHLVLCSWSVYPAQLEAMHKQATRNLDVAFALRIPGLKPKHRRDFAASCAYVALRAIGLPIEQSKIENPKSKIG